MYPASLETARQEIKPVPQPVEPHLRPLVTLLCTLGASLFIGVPLATRKSGWWMFSLVSLGIGTFILRGFLREREIVRNSAVAVGTVTEWQETPGSEGGYDYSVKYHFITASGERYLGEATSHSELPREGCLIEVLYHHDSPDQNQPLEAFWFYDFEFRGLKIGD